MSKAERTKQFIIEKSAAIINKKGMAGTSLSDIMEATKLAKGGIYGNFESKEEICKESFLYLRSQLAAKLDNAVSQGKTAREKLYKLLAVYENKDNMMDGCPILNFGIEADDTNPAIKEQVKRAILSAHKRYTDIIELGVENKELLAEINPEKFAIMAFAMIEGAILCRKVFDNNDQMEVVLEILKNEFERYVV
ncbi:transcriptional regulator, TetR family [Flavobacterium sp. CF108]|uniref:TetR/AcrR family transcriptional regulator n=1 Tax=unclassified Flavobacterium TaxID=196869 RepID=UPI0008ADED9E|nr:MULTISPECIES: TetR/AcrR family transcriptional regulator [unclassified Flavobacterium]SEN90393.1 transcriptional regulator, TetR family [Flavobacterium sp. fv08]SHH25132.1 transcriptional regulator, TetR family [Flavobacterium sp. CF108]